MSALLITVIASGAVSATLALLFLVERRRGRRFGEGARTGLDRGLARVRAFVDERVGIINRMFFRELVHYLMHLALSMVLWIVRSVERATERVVHVNRSKVQSLRRIANADRGHDAPAASSPHFSAIAEHKRSVELSEEEKRMRKKHALKNGH